MMNKDKIKEKFLKPLWHNASEEPEVGKRILIEHTVFGYVNGYKSLMWNGKVDWNKFLENDFEYDANKWLYIDDILPKEGGEQC